MFKPITIREGHDNFFTPLRILMAMAVVIGHAFVIYIGNTDAEPHIFLHYTPSYTAVIAFFILSGFLVTKSMVYRGDLPSYSAARILRIYPALIVHVLIVTFIIGAWMTTLPLQEYLTHKDTLKQMPLVLSFADTNMFLPGVFDENPEKYGSAALWTLRYELLAYIGTALLFIIGALRSKAAIVGIFVACAIAWAAAYRTGLDEQLPATIRMLLRFGIAYGLGAAIYALQSRIKLHVWAIPLPFIAALVLGAKPEAEILYNIGLAYLVFTLAFIRLDRLKALQGVTDISYGVYIWHWVILQVIEAYAPNANVWQLAIPTLIISSVVAWLSWHVIEKPALSRKTALAAWFKLRLGRKPRNPLIGQAK